MTLTDYATAASIRPATIEEWARSILAAERDGGSGVFLVDGRSVYVDGEPSDLEARIERLQQSAAEASDTVQVVICDVALGLTEADEADAATAVYAGHSPDDLSKIRKWLGESPSTARSECARVLAESIVEQAGGAQ